MNILISLYIYCSLLIKVIFSWNVYSPTIINKNGIRDLFGLKAYCKEHYALRGFQIQKPTLSTIRYALDCVEVKIEMRYKFHYVSNQVDCMNNNSLSVFNNMYMNCQYERILYGFSLELYQNNLCGIHYVCAKIEGALCAYNLYYTSSALYYNNVNYNITQLSVIGGNDQIALKQVVLIINENNENMVKYKYSFCVIPQYDKLSKMKSIGYDDTIQIDFYITLKDNTKNNDIAFINEIKELLGNYTDNKKTIIFIPHYITNNNGKHLNDKCINGYCLDTKENVYESIFQSCLYENDVDAYFNYIKKYLQCISLGHQDMCIKNAKEEINNINNYHLLFSCIDDFVIRNDTFYFQGQNVLVSERNIFVYPSIELNGKIISINNAKEITILLNEMLEEGNQFNNDNKSETILFIEVIAKHFIGFCWIIIILGLILTLRKKYLIPKRYIKDFIYK